MVLISYLSVPVYIFFDLCSGVLELWLSGTFQSSVHVCTQVVIVFLQSCVCKVPYTLVEIMAVSMRVSA